MELRIQGAVALADASVFPGKASRRQIARAFMDKGIDQSPELGGAAIEAALDFAEARAWRRGRS